MRAPRRSVVTIPGLVIALLLASQLTYAAQESLEGGVPNSGAWAHYLISRCATYFGGPWILADGWPGTTLHAYVRDPSTNNPLGPTVSWGVDDSTWRDMGDLGTGNCFRISARKDFTGFGGTSTWTGVVDY
jgi:hypothetical protein